MAKIDFGIVKVEHIKAALKFIDENGVAKNHEAKTCPLVFEGKEYPSKYVFAVAYKLAMDENPADAASLTTEYTTNKIRPILEKLGFEYSTEENASKIARLEKAFAEYLKTALGIRGKPIQDNSKKQGLTEFRRDFIRLGYIDKTDSLFKLFDSLSAFNSSIEKVRKEPDCEHLFTSGDPLVGHHLYQQFFIQLDQGAKLKKSLEKDGKGDSEMAKDQKQFAKNMILYGPPGTGKTYNTAIYAVAIADDRSVESVERDKYETIVARYNELKKEGRVAFTTFHQSYSYEEFIEGIRPKLDDASELLYELRAGVFKQFCDKAKKHSVDSPIESESNAFDDGFNSLLEEIANSTNGEITITSKAKKPLKLILQDNGDGLYVVTQNNKFAASRINVRNRYFGIPSGATSLRAYWDAIIDYIVNKIKSSEVKPPIADEAAKRQNYVFIIDEINRGNPSKIFGELITLIEDTKRLGEEEAMTAILPYSNTEFGIPSNIYILGTMNTADRSIALLDTALRRRFDFVEMQPKAELLNGVVIDGIEIGAMLSKINERIAALLDREHTIGHAYFMPLRNKVNPTIDDLAEIMKNKIVPLLQEYFYDNYEKIRLVLGDNQKEDSSLQFIIKLENRIQDLFGNYDNDLIDRYEINAEAFANKEAYGKIK